MEGLTEQETAIYDRQIRVWGVEAQRRLSKSRVLVMGMSGVTAEVCKNLVLAGIGSLAIVDDKIATFDADATFLVCMDDLGGDQKTVAAVSANALKDFNPMVQVASLQGSDLVLEKVIQDYDVVILNRASRSLKKRVNELCRTSSHRVAFYTVDCLNSRGEIFADLKDHSYTSKGTEVKKAFPSFEDVLSVPWSNIPRRTSKLFFAMRVVEEFEEAKGREVGRQDADELIALSRKMCEKQGLASTFIPDSMLRELAEANRKEFPPVSAILGGILGQEVVKALSCKGEPLRSCFYFDTVDGKGVIEDIAAAAVSSH